jgi:glutathione S-transferase
VVDIDLSELAVFNMYSSTELTAIRNTVTAKNFEPEYLQINPNGTIPSLAMPSFAKPLVDSVDILEYLDRSRPDITPLTPTDSSSKKRVQQLIKLVHSAQVDTNLVLLQARSHEELDAKKKSPWNTFLTNRQAVLEKYRGENPSHPFYERRAAENGGLLRLYTSDPSPEHTAFFERTHTQYRDFAAGLDHLDSLLALPYAAGESVTTADLHIVPWLAHAMWGARGEEIDEFEPLEKLIQHSVPEFRIGERTKKWWANMSKRDSFKECYPTLH